MDTGLAGDVVAVLGAAGGIGAAIAHAFAAEGCPVALFDRRPQVGDVAGAIRAAHGVPVLDALVDATDYAAVREAATATVGALGGCQHVVVAVGAGSGKIGMPFWSLEPADWDGVVGANLMSCVHAAHAFVPYLVPQRRGSLCFLSSVAGQIGSQTDPPYSAAKAAVLNFMQCAARDLAAHGVRVNAVSPGMVKTALNRSVWAASQAHAGRRAPRLRGVGSREDAPRHAARALADARGRRRRHGLPGVAARGQRHWPDRQRGRRPGDARLTPVSLQRERDIDRHHDLDRPAVQERRGVAPLTDGVHRGDGEVRVDL
jgi:2-hydroxycyclohexanecarboxyl-CoA dehydrogenase